MKIKALVLLVSALFIASLRAMADGLQWSTPYGDFNLNLKTTEALIGYDAVLKQAIAGGSVPVYTDPNGFVSLNIGAVAPWQTNSATVEPYVSAGHDVLRDIPALDKYQSAHVNIFGRWATSQGKAGVGISFSYAPGGPAN